MGSGSELSLSSHNRAPYMPRQGLWRVLGLRILILVGAISFFAVIFFYPHRPLRPSFIAFHEGDITYKEQGVGTLKWWPCTSKGTEGADCGYIIVPTDYQDSRAGVTKIALARYNSTKSPRKGMLLINPGGPGGSGKQALFRLGSALQTYVGGDYDIVGFDPRGIGETEPRTKCFSDGQYDLFTRNTVLDRGFDVGGTLSDPRLRDGMLRQQKEADAMYKTQYAVCGKTMGDALKYMGTSTVVRDIDFMTKGIEGEDALINFYGFSYGTILGQYLVNMLPHRVGKVVIDGVADAVAWSNQPNYKWYRSWLSSTEDAYGIFLDGCSKAGPEACPLTLVQDEDPLMIRARIETFFDALYEEPLAVPGADIPGIITTGRAQGYVFRALMRPRQWAEVAEGLSLAMRGNGTVLLDATNGRRLDADMERQAVSCNDALPLDPADAPSNEEVVDELLYDLRSVTRFVTSVVTAEPDSGCQYWPVEPPERFSGPWNHTLRNPMLILSNTADPVTPISSGRLVKQLLGDSAGLGVQDGVGHCTLAQSSRCTMLVARAYFANGTLPVEGHICPVDETPFSDKNATMLFSEEEMRALSDMAAAWDSPHSDHTEQVTRCTPAEPMSSCRQL